MKLTWSDFTGTIDPDNHFTAYTAYYFKYHYTHGEDDKLIFTVECFFDQPKSWVRAERNPSSDLLLHEQMHMEIAELYGRKMRKALKEYASAHRYSNATKIDADEIFYGLLDKCKAYTAQYDNETDHSKNEDKQREWVNKIENQLALLYAFDDAE